MTAHEEEMTNIMKEAVKDTITDQMRKGWSLDQITGLFIVAARKALDELKEEY